MQILSSVTLTYQPIYLKELVAIASLPEEVFGSLQSLNELVDLCSSFLTVRKGTVYFIYQSAKDYFSIGKSSKIFLESQAGKHGKITYQSLQVMSDTLRRDICSLQILGTILDKAVNINQDLLAYIQYVCYYQVSHLHDTKYLLHNRIGFCNGRKVYIFLQNHFLHWLKALSLMRNMSDGVVIVTALGSMLIVSDSKNYTSFTG